ncbi:MAG TPA: YwqG family protein [Ktedonobacterales bacterium]|nr:YwqG family protein [Ktedonobacterales bacterium]
MTPDEVRSSLSAAGLGNLTAHLDALTRPGIRLATRAVAQSALAIGASALGGQPDLPPGTAWPAKQGVPMSFVGQIRLEEAAPYDTAHLLPPAGLLSFFYDAQQETYGTQPSDRDGFRVYYFASAAGLQRQPFPAALPAAARFTSCAVTYSSELTLPQRPNAELAGLAWSPQQQEQYEAATASYTAQQRQSGPQNQLLGFPNALQDDMRLECQLASHGISMENAANDPRTQTLSAAADTWHLLFQVDSDPHAGMRWADSGMLYYWIERDALRSANFDNTWVVLQGD